jgi:hypothetical protein
MIVMKIRTCAPKLGYITKVFSSADFAINMVTYAQNQVNSYTIALFLRFLFQIISWLVLYFCSN